MFKWILIGLGAILELVSLFFGKNNKVVRIVGLCTILIGVLWAVIDRQNEVRDERSSALTGTLKSPRNDKNHKDSDSTLSRIEGVPRGLPQEFENTSALIIYFGSNVNSVPLNYLRSGYVFRPLKGLLDSEYPITIKLSEKNILISAKITSIDGKVLAEIIENEWEVNPENYFKRNYDRSAIEVIDDYGNPMLQIDLIDQYSIKLSGIFIDEKNVVIFSTNGLIRMPISIGQEGISKYLLDHPIELLFKYPSDKNLGKRVKESK